MKKVVSGGPTRLAESRSVCRPSRYNLLHFGRPHQSIVGQFRGRWHLTGKRVSGRGPSSGHSTPNLVRFPVRARCSFASPSAGCDSWGDLSPLQTRRLPYMLDHHNSSFLDRGLKSEPIANPGDPAKNGPFDEQNCNQGRAEKWQVDSEHHDQDENPKRKVRSPRGCGRA